MPLSKQPTPTSKPDLDRTLIEFLPAALEIQAAPPPKAARMILWTLVALIIIAVVWACIGQVDIVATAQGKTVPKRQVKVVQPIEAGIVSAIHVVEGQKVIKGQLLLELDPAINQAESQRLTQQLNSLKQKHANKQQLLTLITQNADEAAITDPLLQSQLRLYNISQTTLGADIALNQSHLAATQANLQKALSILPLLKERTASLSHLAAEKMVAREHYLTLKQEEIEMTQQQFVEQANIKRFKAAINSATNSRATHAADFVNTIRLEMAELQLQIPDLKHQLTKSQFLQQQAKLFAPVSGTIENLAVTTIGGVVSPAQELLTLVPQDDELIVEAGLLNKDIGFTYSGQSVEVKIESFPFTRYGVIEGVVIDVSTDAVPDEQLGLIFPVKVALKRQDINIDGRIVPLSAGMTVSAEIKTGKRKLISFLLSPVIKHADEGARER